MVETIRAFKGATELNHAGLELTKSNDIIVNRVNVNCEGTAILTVGSTIDFTKADGSTNIFSAKIINRKKEALWNLQCLSNGWELHNIRVEATWTSKSPEYIVQDVVDTYTTNLTFASSESSGITLTEYEGKGQYAIDIIKDMMDVLAWQLRIDESDNVYFEPNGYTNNGLSYINGTNINIINWDTKAEELVNHVKIIGGFISKLYEETVAGTNTVFNLSHKPTGNVQAVVSGTLIEPDTEGTNYTVDADNKTLTFSVSKTNPTFKYEINQPVIVEDQDDASISKFGMEVFKEIPAPFLTSFSDARKYARAYLSVYSDELIYAQGIVPELNFNLEVGEEIMIIDSIRGETENLVINKIVYKPDEGTTKLFLGPKGLDFWEWQRGVEDRIKKLERRINNEDDIAISRLFKHKLKTTYASTVLNWRYKSPADSFILGHQTLGRTRTSLNFEADCSDNGNNGTWKGSGIGGSQFTTAGLRLSEGVFGGSDTYVDVTATIGDIQTVAFSINPDSLNQDILQLATGKSVSVDSSGDITTTGLSNTTTYVNAVETATITQDVWKHVAIKFDAVTANLIYAGRVGASYYDGSLDEVQIFNDSLSTAEITALNNQYLDANAHTATLAKCQLWWSMDNPKLGDRFGPYVDIV